MAAKNDTHTVFWDARKVAAERDPRFATRAQAAETIGVSEGTIFEYETGRATGTPEMTNDFADAYGAPWLRNWYCKNVCCIGRSLPIATEIRTIEASALRMVHAFDADALKIMIRDLVDIANDGRVDVSEIPRLQKIFEKLDEVLYSVSEVRLLCEATLESRIQLLDSEVAFEIEKSDVDDGDGDYDEFDERECTDV